MWNRFFKAQAFDRPTLKYRDLPLYETREFDFFRCVEFSDDFYGKTVSRLHSGNLRVSNGRYSKLFPNQKLSYWADSAETARAEVKHHGNGKNLLTFWAYDDNSSSFPTLIDGEDLRIIDGRRCGIQDIIDKVDNGEEITDKEQEILREIMAKDPDCLAYDSRVVSGGENFLFFEKGFKKLSLREVRLCLGERKGKNSRSIVCATTSDYLSYPESYGEYFAPIVKVRTDENYLSSEEYLLRKKGNQLSHQKRDNNFKGTAK